MRTEAFKNYVLSRQNKRGNPYNLSCIQDVIPYVRGYEVRYYDYIESYGKSSWTYTTLLAMVPVSQVSIVFPDEVVQCKICKALFLELED